MSGSKRNPAIEPVGQLAPVAVRLAPVTQRTRGAGAVVRLAVAAQLRLTLVTAVWGPVTVDARVW